MSTPTGLSMEAIAELVAQVSGAQPDSLDPVVTTYRDSGTAAAELTLRAEQIDRATAEGFVSAGREVYDAAAATTATRTRLGDGGEHYRWVSDAVRVVAEELTLTRDGVMGAWGLLQLEVRAIADAEQALASAAPTMTQVDVDDRARVLRDRYTSALTTHGGRISRLIESYRDILINRTRVLADLGFGQNPTEPVPTGSTPPPGGTPQEVNAWWDRLGLEGQADLIATNPGLIGNLDGVPAAARDQANRVALDDAVVRYEAMQRDLQAQVQAHEDAVPDWLPYLPPVSSVQRDYDDLAAVTGRLDGLRAIQARLDDPGAGEQAFLLGFRPDTESGGQAIVAAGNPDTATNVVTFVPGTHAAVGNERGDIGGYLAGSDRIAESARRADAEESTSVITWVGYDAPQSLYPQAGADYFADDAQPALRNFQEGLRATHEGPPSFNTVAGHSYGTTVIGHTARDGDLDADQLAFAGSPGVGVDHVDQLRRPPGTVYSTTSPTDLIGVANIPIPGSDTDIAHGNSPSHPDFGATTYPSDGDHGAYYREENPGLITLGQIVVGNGIP